MAKIKHVGMIGQQGKEFLKLFDKLTYSRSAWQVWEDLMTVMACSISNAVDRTPDKFKRREEQYEIAIKNLGGAEVPAQIFNIVVMALEENPNQDFLGQLYMSLNLSNHWRGQFFTPYHVSELMAKITIGEECQKEIEKKGYVSVCDSCVGAGAMLIAAATAFREYKINYQTSVVFVGQDIDPVVAKMAYIQLSLLGCPGYIIVGNSLLNPPTGHVLFPQEAEGQDLWIMPLFMHDTWEMYRTKELVLELFGGTVTTEKTVEKEHLNTVLDDKKEVAMETKRTEVKHFTTEQTTESAYGCTWNQVVNEYLRTGYKEESSQHNVTVFGLNYKVLKRGEVTVFYDADGNTLFDVENERLEKEYEWLMNRSAKADTEITKPEEDNKDVAEEENVEKAIINIKLEEIYQHPDNPRKDLGDLTELSDSIKKNGVMQNLTIIPGHWMTLEEYAEVREEYKKNPSEELKEAMDKKWLPDGYTLIIGHRRCAAAKLAGLTELPCRIVEDMSQNEQVSTMLEENMQRNDLTIYEQAQGFQMMLDLGDTEEQIAEKTGFSKTTIRHRLNIAKLDQEQLKKKEHDDTFQLSLKDLYELEKIEDIGTRNKILTEARDSRDLTWKAQNAVNEAARKKKTDAIVAMLKEAGIKKAPKGAENEQYSMKWEVVKEYDLDKDVPKQLRLPKQKQEETVYYLIYYRSVRVIKKAKKRAETAQDRERKEREKKKKEIKAKMKVMDARRKEFVQNIISGKIQPVKETAEVQEAIWDILIQFGTYVSTSNIGRFFTGKREYECSSEEIEETQKKVDNLSCLHQMIIEMHSEMGSESDNIYDYQGMFNQEKGEKLMNAYKILERYGWSFEGDEEQLLNGTHELYVTKEGGTE